MLYLVRHAKAGSRSACIGDDQLRPLSGPGRRQAKAIAERLAPTLKDAGVATFYSSPSHPLHRDARSRSPRPSVRSSRSTNASPRASSYVAVLDMLWSLPDGTVLCSHGDVIPETIGALERRGCKFTSPPDWRKGSVWVLQRNDHGEIVSAESWPPPDAGQ